VVKYTLEIKQSAQKELDALDNTVFKRIDRRILALADNPRPEGCIKLKGFRDSGAFGWVTGACCISSTPKPAP
jgi:mRNA-degrading endonuclease RelE of RelBE toxin-antitoxin system